ncbi:MAG: nucleotide-binding protein [Deltaproteobacteria bacterium]|nr:nucleotide-binding protein [Deltaproteobacteria bacterium]
MKPKLFIGSSSEALNIAEIVLSLLESKGIESTLWNQGVFGLNSSGLGSLMNACKFFDYACFILRKDDVAQSRGKKIFTVRDNVIFEIGLFLGALGRDRVFVIFERGNKPNLPSDLDGITFLDYNPHRDDNNLQAALTTVCIKISDAVSKQEQKTLALHDTSTVCEPDSLLKVSMLDDSNSRWQNMTDRMNQCKEGETVCFISITGKNFLLPNLQEGETIFSRLGPNALSRGLKLRGIVLDPEGVEAEVRSTIESPHATREHRLLIHDAQEVTNLPAYYIQRYGFGPETLCNLKLKYSKIGLSFGLWLFSDIAFIEPFHFGKRKNVPHLCGFAQLTVKKDSEEFSLTKKHFEVLWGYAKNAPWCKTQNDV